MADSYNELFGLGSHSEDASIGGEWNLQDNAASTAVDDRTSQDNNGVLQGGDNTSAVTTTGPNTWLTAAFNFDADRVEVPDDAALDSTSALTLLLWINTDTYDPNGTENTWIAKNGNYIFRVDNTASPNGLSAYWWDGTNIRQLRLGSDPATGAWQHWAMVVSANDLVDFYLNSAAQSLTPSTLTTGSRVLTNNFTIGGRDGVTTNRIDGKMAGVSVFTRALSAAEIADAYNGPEPINSVAPVMSGVEAVGQSLSCSTGTWALPSPFASGSNGTITYAYQWTRSDDDSGTNEADISGATSSSYTLVSADVGKYIRCRVAASNDGGNDADADTNSNFSLAVVAGGGAGSVFRSPVFG